MNLNDKIKHILTEKNISPSHFADEIGIQRSSISHILAGRNKPSLEIVQKVIMRFPELGMKWIMDHEELPEIQAENLAENTVKEIVTPIKQPELSQPELNRADLPAERVVQANLPAKTEPVKKEKTVERVIIFYTDGSLQEYKP